MRKVAILVVALALCAAPAAFAQTAATTTPCTTPSGAPVINPDDQLRQLPCSAQIAPDTVEKRSNTAAFLLLFLVAAIAIGIGGLFAATRFLGLEPRWLATTRQAIGEAGWRASGAWADFRDWLRTSS